MTYNLNTQIILDCLFGKLPGPLLWDRLWLWIRKYESVAAQQTSRTALNVNV